MDDLIPIALCADDFALSPGVDDGILALAQRGRVTAVSCLTASPHWARAAPRLNEALGQVDIGLHFALTQLTPLGPMPILAPDGRLPPLREVYSRALRRAVDQNEIEAELTRQLDAFARAMGRPPDFLDGHHHVHQLPLVRAAVARVWRARAERGWIRNTAATPARIVRRGVAVLRAALLAAFGTTARRTWRAAGIATNADFSGVRSFTERGSYRALMRRYLIGARPGLLVMCHPGNPDEELGRIDTVTATRAEELTYLGSEAFVADLATAGCRLARLSALVAQ